MCFSTQYGAPLKTVFHSVSLCFALWPGTSLSPLATSPCVYHSTSSARTGETQDKRNWHNYLVAPCGRVAQLGEQRPWDVRSTPREEEAASQSSGEAPPKRRAAGEQKFGTMLIRSKGKQRKPRETTSTQPNQSSGAAHPKRPRQTGHEPPATLKSPVQ